jgi:class 3 adenylate cyclase
MASDISRGWNSRVTIRRLAAILAADMVGYSRLMGVDEATVHAFPPRCCSDLHLNAYHPS